MDADLAGAGMALTGVVRCLDAKKVCCVANGQIATLTGFEFEEGQMATLYYMKKSFNVTETAWYLSRQMQSKAVIIPGDEDKYMSWASKMCAQPFVGFHQVLKLWASIDSLLWSVIPLCVKI